VLAETYSGVIMAAACSAILQLACPAFLVVLAAAQEDLSSREVRKITVLQHRRHAAKQIARMLASGHSARRRLKLRG
jgi:predicted alpha/beta-hydrolase family hydrolase